MVSTSGGDERYDSVDRSKHTGVVAGAHAMAPDARLAGILLVIYDYHIAGGRWRRVVGS